jgi:hypothetical protein
MITVYYDNHIKSINTFFWGYNAELLNVKTGGTYSYHTFLKSCEKQLLLDI